MEDVGKNSQDFDVFHVYFTALQKRKMGMFVCACLSVCVHAGSHDVSFSHAALAKKKGKKGGIAADVSLPLSFSAAAARLPLKRFGKGKKWGRLGVEGLTRAKGRWWRERNRQTQLAKESQSERISELALMQGGGGGLHQRHPPPPLYPTLMAVLLRGRMRKEGYGGLGLGSEVRFFEFTAHFETSCLDAFAALQVVVACFTNSWETALIGLLCFTGLHFMTELRGTSCSAAGTQQKTWRTFRWQACSN